MTDRNADPQTPNPDQAPRPMDRRPDDNRFGYGSDGYDIGEGNDPSATDSGDATPDDSPVSAPENSDPQGR